MKMAKHRQEKENARCVNAGAVSERTVGEPGNEPSTRKEEGKKEIENTRT